MAEDGACRPCESADALVRQCLAEFNGGFSCAEAVFLVGCRYLGVESDLVPAVSTAFGGGLSRTRSLCGALAGAAMVISVKYGRHVPTDDRTAVVAKVQELVGGFRGAFGCDNCYEITGLDLNTPEGQAAYKQGVHAGVCTGVVDFCMRKAIELCG